MSLGVNQRIVRVADLVGCQAQGAGVRAGQLPGGVEVFQPRGRRNGLEEPGHALRVGPLAMGFLEALHQSAVLEPGRVAPDLLTPVPRWVVERPRDPSRTEERGFFLPGPPTTRTFRHIPELRKAEALRQASHDLGPQRASAQLELRKAPGIHADQRSQPGLVLVAQAFPGRTHNLTQIIKTSHIFILETKIERLAPRMFQHACRNVAI